MVNIVSVLIMKTLRTIGHFSLSLGATDRRTQVCLWRLTKNAIKFACCRHHIQYGKERQREWNMQERYGVEQVKYQYQCQC